jgi:hypothetical protein
LLRHCPSIENTRACERFVALAADNTAARFGCDVRHFTAASLGSASANYEGIGEQPMFATEDEAAKIGCPILTLAFGRYLDNCYKADGVCCQGAHCMLWRWQAEPSPRDESERKGFCGLGGRPVES